MRKTIANGLIKGLHFAGKARHYAVQTAVIATICIVAMNVIAEVLF